MVGLRDVIQVLSALGGGTSDGLSIETLDDSSLPESSSAGEAQRQGLDDTISQLPAA
jgi:hypothetical protein